MTRQNFATWLIGWPRYSKRALLILSDLFLLTFALWAAFSLRLSTFFVPETLETALIFAAAPVIGVITFYMRGLYRLVTRYIGPRGAVRIYSALLIATSIWAVLVLVIRTDFFPRTILIFYPILAAILLRLSRQFAGVLLKTVPHATPATFRAAPRVAIWGAGQGGMQLLGALSDSRRYKPVAFIDDDPSLWGRYLNGLRVYRPEKIQRLIEKEGIEEVLLAIPSANRNERRAAIERLEPHGVVVKTLPALEDIASGQVQISDLRPIDVDDLLGRDPVPPDLDLLTRNVTGKSVMITGAGGTIGSELSRQVLRRGPATLVLFELSEAALYEIELQLEELLVGLAKQAASSGKMPHESRVVGVLGSVLDGELVRRTLQLNAVDTVYHAAAYKHVPIVEMNPVVGLTNNTFGTLEMAQAALELRVERFVLVSTDKAVRPTSIMGASKRLAELVLQALAMERDTQTVFTMVRFGNVLDSSGSVVGRFRRQIKAGGPITVTHPEILRYFMSIPEAAELVIQAGAMAEGGDVFVLDMGTPVKIDDLARKMVHLSGLEVRDSQHPDGDIAIDYIGLRQGEKLYEELLIGDAASPTPHPRIARTSEPCRSFAELTRELDRLRSALQREDHAQIRAVLQRLVEGYQPDSERDADPDDRVVQLARALP